jgi:hypothetical protein
MQIRLGQITLSLAVWTIFPLGVQAEGSPFPEFLQNTCLDCHDEDQAKGNLRLDDVPIEQWSKQRWDHVVQAIAGGVMPPSKKKILSADEKKLRVHQLLVEQNKFFLRKAKDGYQHFTYLELAHALRKWSGLPLKFLDELPEDPKVYNFESNAELLKITPERLQVWLETIKSCVELWIEVPTTSALKPFFVSGASMKRANEHGGVLGGTGYMMYSHNTLSAEVHVPQDGSYRLQVKCWSTQCKKEWAKFIVLGSDDPRTEYLAAGTEGQPTVVEILIKLKRGEQTIGLEFINDFWDPQAKDISQRDRNLSIEWIKLEGPIDPEPWVFSQSHHNFFLGKPQALKAAWTETQRHENMQKVAEYWLPQFFRRRVSRAEIQYWLQEYHLKYKSLQHHEKACREWLSAILLSPEVWVRPRFSQALKKHIVTKEFELRARMALWADLPRAQESFVWEGQTVSSTLLKQVVEDERFEHFINRFMGQWLRLNELPRREIDRNAFPMANRQHLKEVHQESLAFCWQAWKNNMEPCVFLTEAPIPPSNNWSLQQWIKGDASINAPSQRRGFVSSLAFLTLSSYAHRTSPVLRGKIILENWLGEKVPPAPPTAPSFDEAQLRNTSQSLEKQLQQHLTQEDCKSCHQRMDPIGIALEGFGAMGEPRANIRKNNVRYMGLLAHLKKEDARIREHFLRQLWVYLTGEEPDPDIALWALEFSQQQALGFQDLLACALIKLHETMADLSVKTESGASP